MAQLLNLLGSGLGLLLFLVLIVLPAVKIVKQWERGVVLRLGRYVSTTPRSQIGRAHV